MPSERIRWRIQREGTQEVSSEAIGGITWWRCQRQGSCEYSQLQYGQLIIRRTNFLYPFLSVIDRLSTETSASTSSSCRSSSDAQSSQMPSVHTW